MNVFHLVSGRGRLHKYIYDERFDKEYGTETRGVLAVDEMAVDERLRAGAERYEAADPACVQFLLECARIEDKDQFSFVDIGSGKGRVLILAALAGFRHLIGVELDPTLNAIAARNVELVRGRFPSTVFETINADATTFTFPPQRIVCFLNNPFGVETLLKVVGNLERSLACDPRDCVLVYMHSFHADPIRARSRWTQIDEGEFNIRTPYVIWRWSSQ